MKRHIAYASLAEAALLLLLDFQGSTADILSQPFQMKFVRGEKHLEHTPDYFVLRDTAAQEVWDVRPYSLIDGRLKEGAALTREFCVEVGFTYYLFDAVKESVRRNLEWLHAYASVRCSPPLEQRIELMTLFEAPGRTIAEALVMIDAPQQSLRVWIFHLLWHQHLTFDVERPLNDFRRIVSGAPHVG